MAELNDLKVNGDLEITGMLTAQNAVVTGLEGLTATVSELNFMDGVTSNVQTQLNSKAASSHTHSNYATSDHTHSGYAASSHTHSNYAASSHTHSTMGSSSDYNQISVRNYTGTPTLSDGTNRIYFQEDWTNNCVNVGINGAGAIGVNRARTLSATLPVNKGGTGATTASNARTNLNFIGAQPISSISNDTVQKWGGLGSGCAFIHTSSTINSQPSQYGMILNVTNGEAEVHQLWMTQSSGDIYHRGGNSSGWAAHWTKLLDASNYSSYCASASHSHSLSSLGAKFTTIVSNGSAATSASWTNNAFDFLIGCVRPASSNTPACFSIATAHCSELQITDEVQCTVWNTTGTGMTRKSGSGTIFGLWGVNVV